MVKNKKSYYYIDIVILDILVMVYFRNEQTFHTKGHVGKTFEAEGRMIGKAKKAAQHALRCPIFY